MSGKIGITMNFDWHEPKNMSNPRDLEASDIGNDFFFGWFGDPIFLTGDYPKVMRDKIGSHSRHQNLNESRLPSFSSYEKSFIKGIFLKFSQKKSQRYQLLICYELYKAYLEYEAKNLHHF